MRKPVLGALALLVLVSCSSSPSKQIHYFDPLGNGGKREQWLFDQRAYPFGEIPADARRNALQQVRAEIAKGMRTNAAPVSWRAIGPNPVNVAFSWKTATGRVKALAVSPIDQNLVLAGSSSGGIWRSTDAGLNFKPVSDTHSDLSVGAIGFAPSDPNIVYAVSGSDFLGTGVLKSTDAGATWQVVDGPSFAPRGTANRMVIDAADPNRLWVAQTSLQDAVSGNIFSSGIMRSFDGGFTWNRVFRGLISDFAVQPGTSNLLVGIPRNDGGGLAGVYRSTDGGTNWTMVLQGQGSLPRFFFSYSPSNPSRVYMQSYMNNVGRIHVSNDGGATWSEVATTLLVNLGRPSFLVAHPTNDAQIFLGYPGGDLHVSTDGGATWRNITKSRNDAGQFVPVNSLTHVDQHALVFAPNDPNVMYLGNDGGIYKSTDGATTFTSLAATLSLVQAYRIDAHPTDGSVIFLGTQDNGLERIRDGEWREIFTGDYGSVLFDSNNPSRYVTNYIYGTIIAFNGDTAVATRTTSATFNESATAPRISFVAPFEHHSRTNALYFGTWRLFVSNDFGVTWTAPAGFLDLTRGETDTLTAIGLSSSDTNVIYTGSATGRLMITRDGGTNWTDITGTLPQRTVKAITVDRSDPNIAWLAFSGYRTDHVYRTSDGGATWESVSQGLPDIPVNALLIDPKDRNTIYAGTDIGPFRFSEGRWEFIGTGMPPVVVTAFDITATGRIVAATYGRGAYELVTPIDGAPRRRSVRH